MKVKIIDPNIDFNKLKPAYEGDAGIDLYACIPGNLVIKPYDQVRVNTGVQVAIPDGWVGLLLPRSSAGVKGLVLANTAGVIDSSYRGEIIAMCYNRTNDYIMIKPYDKFCQLLVVPHYDYTSLELVLNLPPTTRGEKGFGSSGK